MQEMNVLAGCIAAVNKLLCDTPSVDFRVAAIRRILETSRIHHLVGWWARNTLLCLVVSSHDFIDVHLGPSVQPIPPDFV